MSDPGAYEKLAAHFDISAHKKVKKGGREQTYIPWTDKVERFNQVLGNHWSFRIIREGMTETEAWVLGELSVTVDGVTTVRQQYGCEAITRGQNATPVTDLFKIAGTDALSKAASLYGCGLYLSIQEERAEVEAAMQAEVAARIRAEREANKPSPKAPPATASTSSAGTTVPSTTAGAPADSDLVRDAAAITGANPVQQRWARLVAEATRMRLPTLGTIKAIDPRACGDAQLNRHADRLEARLYELKDQQGAA